MAKWIEDWTEGGSPQNLACQEVHGTRNESYNAITGSPLFTVQLAVPWDSRNIALRRLLGRPEIWPYDSLFVNVVCVSANVVDDKSKVLTPEQQTIIYSGNALINVTYTPRPGNYMTVQNIEGVEGSQDVYWHDEEEVRHEERTQNPKFFQWGTQTSPTDVPATNDKQELTGSDIPNLIVTETALIHHVEGWPGLTDHLKDLIGKTNDTVYFSRPRHKTYEVGTLMLRTYSLQSIYSFRSFRAPKVEPGPTYYDPSGIPTDAIRMVYEYKKLGWKRWWRANSRDQNFGYYYLLWNTGSVTIPVDPFPQADHSQFLTGLVRNLNHS